MSKFPYKLSSLYLETDMNLVQFILIQLILSEYYENNNDYNKVIRYICKTYKDGFAPMNFYVELARFSCQFDNGDLVSKLKMVYMGEYGKLLNIYKNEEIHTKKTQ